MIRNKRSRAFKILLWTLGIIILLGGIAQLLFGQMVQRALEDEVPENIQLTYGKLSTNVLLGRIRLHNVSLHALNGGIDFKSPSVTASGLRYARLLRTGDLEFSRLELLEPKVNYRSPKKETSAPRIKKRGQKNIAIETLSISEGQLQLFEEESNCPDLSIQNIDIRLDGVCINGETRSLDLPFSFDGHQLSTGEGSWDLGALETLQWQKIHLDSLSGLVQDLKFQTKFSKEELSKRLAVENDHYELEVDSIFLRRPDLGPGRIHMEQMNLFSPNFQVYRDKLLPDDTTHKKLFNRLLRDLGPDLQVDTVFISGGSLSYTERLEVGINPEKLLFTDISAKIANLHNRGCGKVQLDIGAELMGDGPLGLDWSFDPWNKSNDFLIKGSLSNFDTRNISPFLRSNLSAEVEGGIDRLYFTISGNEMESRGDLKMAYGEFGFVVLKKDRSGVNRFLTALVNLFAKDGNKADADGFRHGHFTVERKRDRSFFNYLWLNIKEGLVASMTGNGNKQND